MYVCVRVRSATAGCGPYVSVDSLLCGGVVVVRGVLRARFGLSSPLLVRRYCWVSLDLAQDVSALEYDMSLFSLLLFFFCNGGAL